MPKKPNSEIRSDLHEIIADLNIEAGFIRDTLKDLDRIKSWLASRADYIDEIAAWIDQEADHLHNAKPLKPRARIKSPKVTKAMARTIKTMAAMGIASDQIAAQFNINPGRVTDALNGKYD